MSSRTGSKNTASRIPGLQAVVDQPPTTRLSDLRGHLGRPKLGKQHYLDVHIDYRQAYLNAIEYLKKFGYSGAQAYSILGTAAEKDGSPH